MQMPTLLISLLLETDVLEMDSGMTTSDFWTPGAMLFCAGGLLILLTWSFRYGGFKALRDAPVRRNRLIGFEALAFLGGWLLLMVGINFAISVIFVDASFVFQQTLSYPAMIFLELGVIAMMVLTAHFTFARRLKGFGLNVRTVGRDGVFAMVYLIAVYPLILFSLWLVLTVGQFFDEDFGIEVHQSLTFLTENANLLLTAMLVLFSVVIVPVFEEMLFRGFLQTTIRSLTCSPWLAIILTSVLFSLLHPTTHWPALFFLSCGLGYAYERSGSLIRSILMHVFFNGISVAATFWTG